MVMDCIGDGVGGNYNSDSGVGDSDINNGGIVTAKVVGTYNNDSMWQRKKWLRC